MIVEIHYFNMESVGVKIALILILSAIFESFSIPIFENTSPFDNGEIVLRDPENGDVCLIVNLNITLINTIDSIRIEVPKTAEYSGSCRDGDEYSENSNQLTPEITFLWSAHDKDDNEVTIKWTHEGDALQIDYVYFKSQEFGLDGEFDHFGIAEINVKDGAIWKSDKLVKVATDGTTGNAIYISGFIMSKIDPPTRGIAKDTPDITSTDLTNEPTSDLTTDEPTSNLTTDEPTSDLTTDEPTSDLTNQPTSDLTTHEPTSDLTTQPTSDLTTNEPTSDLTTDEPTSDLTTQSPTDLTSEPSTDGPTDSSTDSSSSSSQNPTSSSTPSPPNVPDQTIKNEDNDTCIAASLNLAVTVPYKKRNNETGYSTVNIPTDTANTTGSCNPASGDYVINYSWTWETEKRSVYVGEKINDATVNFKKEKGQTHIAKLVFNIIPSSPIFFPDAADQDTAIVIEANDVEVMPVEEGNSIQCQTGQNVTGASGATNTSISVSGRYEIDGDTHFSEPKLCPADEEANDDDGGDSPVAAIAGGTVAALIVLIAIGGFGLYFYRNRKESRQKLK